jgi:hypothetical protein
MVPTSIASPGFVPRRGAVRFDDVVLRGNEAMSGPPLWMPPHPVKSVWRMS